MKNKSTISAAMLLLTALIWGFAFVAQVEGLAFMGSLTFGGIRFAMGAFSLLPLILIFERRPGGVNIKKTLLYGLLGGVVLFCASTLQQYGIAYTQSAGKAGFITGLYTVLVPIIGIFMGRKTRPLTWLGALAALTGLYFLSMKGGKLSFGFGDILLLIGAVFWAFHILIVDQFASQVPPLRFSITQFFVCGVLSLAGAFIFEKPSVNGILTGWQPLLYGGIASVGVAYTLQIVGQRHVEPARAAIIFSLETLFAALGGVLLLHEFLGWRGYFGGALMFLGIVLAQLGARTPAFSKEKRLRQKFFCFFSFKKRSDS
ncbi:MAG: DMT family transporter [Oscillospiraceae bacterium]|jgi:drug/metabolite transporter (DMT)-like permease|nr:DMT family transporter [Oscillospiraceae bacterium]